MATRLAWKRLEAGAARMDVVTRQAVKDECAERGVSRAGVAVFAGSLAREAGADAWPNEASRGATERAFRAYLDEKLYEAAAGVRGAGGMRPEASRQVFLGDLGSGLKRARSMAQWESARMWRLLEEGDGAGAVEPFANAMALGGVAMRTPTLVARLGGGAIVQIPSAALTRWIVAHGLDEPTAMAFAHALDAQRAALPDLSFTLEGERLWTLGEVDQIFEDLGAGRHDPRYKEELKLLAIRGGQRETALDAVERYYPALEAWAALPVRERRAAKDQPSDDVESMQRDAPLAAHLVNTAGASVSADDWRRARLDGLRIMLALEAYHARHGAYPETLAALAPAFIDAIPDDPYAPDGAWRYRLVEPHSMAGVTMPYVLYSVGYDGADDDAERAKIQTSSLMPGAPGTDFVVNAISE